MRKSTRTVGITAAILIVGTGTAAAFMVSNDKAAAPAPVPRPVEAAIPFVKPTPTTTVDPGISWEISLHDGLLANYSALWYQTQVDMCDSLRSLGTGKQLADFILSAEYGSYSAALGTLYVTPEDLAGIPAGVPPQQVLELAGDAVLEFCRA